MAFTYSLNVLETSVSSYLLLIPKKNPHSIVRCPQRPLALSPRGFQERTSFPRDSMPCFIYPSKWRLQTFPMSTTCACASRGHFPQQPQLRPGLREAPAHQPPRRRGSALRLSTPETARSLPCPPPPTPHRPRPFPVRFFRRMEPASLLDSPAPLSHPRRQLQLGAWPFHPMCAPQPLSSGPPS